MLWLTLWDQGYSTLTLRGPEPAGVLFLPDNQLHPPGVQGLNQSLTGGEQWKNTVELVLGSRFEIGGL